MSIQPRDDSGMVIPALGLAVGRGSNLSFTSSSANNSAVLSKATDVITITSTASAFVEVGVNVTATPSVSHYIVASTPYDIALPERTPNVRVSVIGAGTSGTLYISERS